jgi:type IV pilus assembly protein PilO
MKDWPWQRYVILGVCLIALFYFFWYKPKGAQLKVVREDRLKVEEEVGRLRAKKVALDKIEAETITLNKTLKDLEAVIPQKKETSDILSSLHQLATGSRLNIDKFIPKGEIDKDYYYEWQLSIEITGNFHNLATFFDRLGRFHRLFTVDSFAIKALPAQSEASTISAAFIAKTYIFREEAVVTKEVKGKREKKKI